MTIRLSRQDDLPALMAILQEAQRTIATLGIDQWQNGYPSEAVIALDIALGRSYVVERDGSVLGTFVLADTEPTYDHIYEGQWHSQTYIAIHRVAVRVSYRGTGVSDSIIDYALGQASRMGCEALRIDTHRGNIPMRRMLEKQGFQYSGVIFLADGSHRVAYEKNLR